MLADAQAHETRDAVLLYAITQELGKAYNLTELLQTIVAAAAEIFNTSTAAILLHNRQEEEFELAAAQGLAIPLGTRFSVGVNLAWKVAETPNPPVVQDPYNAEFQEPLIEGGGTRRFTQVPMLFHGELVGLLSVGFANAQGYTRAEEDVRLLAILAAQAASAIHDAQLLKVVEHTEAKVEALSQQLIQTQEEERRRLAREIHDEVGQGLTVLKLDLNRLKRLPPAAMEPRLVEMEQQVDDLVERVRELSRGLRPSVLDDLGLYPALKYLFQRYAKTPLHIQFEHQGLERRFHPEIETAAYRIIQEALTNAARHAQVDRVTVRAWADSSLLTIKIQDEGAGFGEEARLATGRQGLIGMRERAVLLGGRLMVESMPGLGTRVIAELPLEAQAHSRAA